MSADAIPRPGARGGSAESPSTSDPSCLTDVVLYSAMTIEDSIAQQSAVSLRSSVSHTDVDADDVIDVDEVAKRLGKHEQTIRNWYRHAGLPAYQIGSGPKAPVYFIWPEVVKWVMAHGSPATAEPRDTVPGSLRSRCINQSPGDGSSLRNDDDRAA